jgi:hypothetical protein
MNVVVGLQSMQQYTKPYYGECDGTAHVTESGNKGGHSHIFASIDVLNS